MRKNIALSFAVLLLAYIGLEESFLWWFPRVMPAAVVVENRYKGLNVLFQSSKSSVLPHNYIALFGDSNALGMGDWFTEEMRKPMARYQSSHVLQDILRRDVVSFASPGAGSMRGMVTEPISQSEYIREHIAHDFEKPAWILVYFYEGNDLYDNVSYFQYSFPKLFDINKATDIPTYLRYTENFGLQHDVLYRKAHENRWVLHFPFIHFMESMYFTWKGMKDPYDIEADTSFDPPWIFGATAFKSPGQINHAHVAGQEQQLPDRLQAPALLLNDAEWQQSWFTFEQALQYSQRYFAESHFVIVYVPSVLSIYSLTREQVSVQPFERKELLFSRQALVDKSTQMRETLKRIAQRNNVPVIDTSITMQQAGQQQFLHGPNDWNHLNRKGYEVLAKTIAQQLQPLMLENASPHKD